MQGAEGAEIISEPVLVKSPFLREAFGAAKQDMRNSAISDAEFERLWRMPRDKMRAVIDDYEGRCTAWEVIWMQDGHMPEGAQVRTPIGYKKKPIPAKLRWAVFKRDGYCCVRCGSEEDLAADHIHSEARGGETTLENLQTLCVAATAGRGHCDGYGNQ
jgi:hypothetical protein